MIYILVIVVCAIALLTPCLLETKGKLVLSTAVVFLIEFFRSIITTYLYFHSIRFQNLTVLLAGPVLACLSFSLGYLLITKFLDTKELFASPKQLKNKLKKNYDPFPALGVLTNFGIYISIGIILYGGSPPVMQAILGIAAEGLESTAVTEMSAIRAEVSKGHIFGGGYKGQGILKIVLRSGLTLTMILALLNAMIYKGKRHKLIIVFVAVVSSFFLLGDGSRGPLVKAIICMAIGYSLLKPLHIKHIVIAIFSVFLLAVATSFLSPKGAVALKQENPITSMLSQIGRRITIGNAQNDVIAFKLMDLDILKSRKGALHRRDLIASLPGSAGGPPFASELSKLVNGKSTTFYLTGTYFTKAFVDYEYLGILFGFIAIGSIVAFYSFCLAFFNHSPAYLAIYCVFLYNVGYLATSGPLSIPPLIIVFGFHFFILIIIKKARSYLAKNI